MTVTVTLPDGLTDKYMRFGDAYVKHDDGTLDVIVPGPDSRTETRWGSGPASKATKTVGRRAVSGVDHEPRSVAHRFARLKPAPVDFEYDRAAPGKCFPDGRHDGNGRRENAVHALGFQLLQEYVGAVWVRIRHETARF